MSSAVRRARGNTKLYVRFPDVADLAFDNTDLATSFASGDAFPEVKSAPFNTSTGTIDVTSWDSGDWQEVVPDIHSGTIAISANLILSNPNLLKIASANDKGKAVAYLLVFGDTPAAMAKNYCVAGFARMTGYNLESTDVHTVSITLTIDGQPTFEQNATDFPTIAGVF